MLFRSEEWLEEIKGAVGELPGAKKERFRAEYGLSEYDAGVLTAERQTAEYYEAAVKAGGGAKMTANLVTQWGLKTANERGCGLGELGVRAERMAKLAQLAGAGLINATAAGAIWEKMLTEQGEPQDLAESMNLIQRSDAGFIEAIVEEVLAANQDAVEEALSGSKKAKKARGFLMGQIMQKAAGKANPQVAGEILDRRMTAEGGSEKMKK